MAQTPEGRLRAWVESNYTHVPLREKDTGPRGPRSSRRSSVRMPQRIRRWVLHPPEAPGQDDLWEDARRGVPWATGHRAAQERCEHREWAVSAPLSACFFGARAKRIENKSVCGFFPSAGPRPACADRRRSGKTDKSDIKFSLKEIPGRKIPGGTGSPGNPPGGAGEPVPWDFSIRFIRFAPCGGFAHGSCKNRPKIVTRTKSSGHFYPICPVGGRRRLDRSACDLAERASKARCSKGR